MGESNFYGGIDGEISDSVTEEFMKYLNTEKGFNIKATMNRTTF